MIARVRFVLLALLALAALPAPGAHAAFPGENGLIAFQTNDGGDYDVWVMNRDGSGKENLTADSAALDGGPSWSPDGRKLAFVSERDGDAEIFVMDFYATGRPVTQVTTNSAHDTDPAWSADGTQLAFVRVVGGNADVWRIDADGQNEQNLTSAFPSNWDADPSWSAGSPGKIAFASDRAGTFQVFTMNPDGSSQTQIVTSGVWSSFPNWAPDASKIAYHRISSSVDIYEIPAGGGSETGLVTDSSNDSGPAYSPDGTRVAFGSDRSGQYEVYATPAGEGNPEQLTSFSPGSVTSAPDWQPAPVGTIATDRLDVHVNSLGQITAGFDDGAGGHLFYPSGSEEPDAGFHLTVYGPEPTILGPLNQRFTPIGTPTVEEESPGQWVATASFEGRGVRVTETVRYTEPPSGDSDEVLVEWTLHNMNDGAVNLRPAFFGDLFIGSDKGTGRFSEVSGVRRVGGVNDHFGASVDLREEDGSVWGGYQEGVSGDVLTAMREMVNGYNDTIDAGYVENAVGVEWEDIGNATDGLAAFATRTYQLTFEFDRFDALSFGEDPQPIQATAGDTVQVPLFTRKATVGVPRTVCYSIAGANPQSSSITTTTLGTGSIPASGANAGQDTITAFADSDLSGCGGGPSPGEPARTRTINRAAAPQPPEEPPPGGGGEPPLSLALDPPAAERDAGAEHQVGVLVQRGSNPVNGQAVRYEVTGPNPVAPASVTTGGDGRSTIAWRGQSSGTDTLTAFADANADGSRQADEPQATATVAWRNGLPPSIETAPSLEGLSNPEAAKELNVEPVSSPAGNETYVRLPGTAARASQAGGGPPPGFIPLVEAAQLPVGSIVETTRGGAKIEAAGNLKGTTTSTSTFYAGRFQMLQARARRPIAEMVLKGGSFRSCGRAGKGAARAAARRGKRVRRLWGDGRGRFRTRGRYSAATVRGTKWLVEDFCGGTLTKVARGTVEVRDLRRRKTVTVKAPRSHFAGKSR